MPGSGARDAVIEFLVAPAGEAIATTAAASARQAWPVATVHTGKLYVARPESIVFLKERALDARRLFAVEFDDHARNRWSYLVAAEHDGVVWTAHDVAGGTNGPPSTSPAPSTSVSRPIHIHIYGQWGPSGVYAAGDIPPGVDVAQVRLTLTDGTQLTDDGRGGVALFLSPHGSAPASVDVFDHRGSLLSSRLAF